MRMSTAKTTIVRPTYSRSDTVTPSDVLLVVELAWVMLSS
jgi:hypothetical protein